MKKQKTFAIICAVLLISLSLSSMTFANSNNQCLALSQKSNADINSFYINNRKSLIDKIDDNSIVLLEAGKAHTAVSVEQLCNYVVDKNFYYLTGIPRPNAIVAITKIAGKVEEYLFIEEINSDVIESLGPEPSIEEATNISGIKNVMYMQDYIKTMTDITKANKINNFYIDFHANDESEYIKEKLKKENFFGKVKTSYSFIGQSINIKNLYNILSGMRYVKTPNEIENIKKAISITENGINNVLMNLKPGVMEYQLEAYFNFVLNSNGVKYPAFSNIVASGKNAMDLHYSVNNCKVGPNDLVLLDLGAKYKNYSGDITRTFPASGKFTEQQKQIYNIVLKAQLETIKAIKPGITRKDVEDTAYRVLSEECKKIGLIKNEEELRNYYPHAVSHSLGLDTHDAANYKEPLKPGVVLTVEPGLYIPQYDIGIRIEDDVVVTKDGCEVLSNGLVKTVDDIETLMAKYKK